MNDVWAKHALYWKNIGKPLKPSIEDNHIMMSFISNKKKKIVVLGVTPEIINMPWNKESELIAIDSNEMMIKNVFNSTTNSKVFSLLEYWDNTSLKNKSIDYILGDGSLNALPSFDIYKSVLSELSRILKDEGKIILRLFSSPEKKDSIENIKYHVEKKELLSFHALKWEIAMFLTKEEAVSVENIRNLFNQMYPDRELLSKKTGWDINEINTIDSYENSSNIYTFPTLSSFKALIKESNFIIEDIRFPSYKNGDRYPTLLLGLKK